MLTEKLFSYASVLKIKLLSSFCRIKRLVFQDMPYLWIKTNGVDYECSSNNLRNYYVGIPY